VAISETVWLDLVQQAAIAGDGVELSRLFAIAHEIFGPQAGERWADALSGLDGTAVTG
jgi:hypothetical protein